MIIFDLKGAIDCYAVFFVASLLIAGEIRYLKALVSYIAGLV
jgi:hypothetical protein